MFSTKTVMQATGASSNQIKYWVKTGIISPEKSGKNYSFSFREIIKIRLITDLKKNELSLQKIRAGIENLARILPDSDENLSNLIIYTDGSDMIVNEKGQFFSAITSQRYLILDTSKIISHRKDAMNQEREIKKEESNIREAAA